MVKITPHMFFDRQAVTGAVSRAKRAVLSKAGAFIRQRARTLIRPRRRSARPGQAPSSHTGDLRRLIWFGYERERDTVVIGPAPLHGRSPYGPTTVPEVLEFGGTVTTTQDHRRPGQRVRRRYRGHPYMGPAMEAEQDRFADLWRNSVRR